MCKCIQLRFSCLHTKIITLSACRGTYSRHFRHDDVYLPSCSSRASSISIAQSSQCPWCARKQMYATMRGPFEYIRTVNYDHRTAATEKAVAEAEAKYHRDMADLERMKLTKPGKRRKVRSLSAHEKVCGGSPLRRELRPGDLEKVVVDGVAESGCESEDDGPSPSLMGGIISDAEDKGVLETSAEKRSERREDEVNKPDARRDRDGDVRMLDSGGDLLCRCRPGYLCEYC